MPELFSEELFEESVEKPEIKDNADEKSIAEVFDLEFEARSLMNKNYAQNIEQRKVYADLIFSLVCIWLTMVLIILIAAGRGDLKLSDTVLSLLIGTTTANVCGFLLFVVKYLFNVEASSKDSTSIKKKRKQ
ncbi:hypothetical protein SAMN04487898_105149 [Pedobacter sp. ok626]|uniref:hypothetical protein n=1 Tax=Pedobacter sp. ok626 TaxID=1761882 RepID=UPI0008839B4D|nr:hypothetical protein [Pedobacter sp. ok626]SDJ95726.1 hypothetical protein SAMN04487898_105149 [Pedobacter sp. ok626]